VQKHAASRLHYDFRLELDGVLKSWAVPKGPSMNPADKRLAVAVEDHPLDYRTFEGTIPEGNYGAGTVIVWDEGTYETPQNETRQEIESQLRKGLAAGRLSVILQGKKLTGEFTLIRLRRGTGNEWLLIKVRDEFATLDDVTADDRSVKTGRTIPEVATNGKPKRHNTTAPKAKKVNLADATTARFPHHVKPMLATLTDAAFDRPAWLFEIKWDGFRAIAEIQRGNVRLYSRNQKPLDLRFPSVFEPLHGISYDAVIDGEIVALDENGISRFQLLQNYQRTGKGRLAYYVFDLLHLNGHDTMTLPLVRRKELLAKIIPKNSIIQLSDHVEEQGLAFFEEAASRGLEGIMAKDSSSRYHRGVRTLDWLKIKTHQRQEAVIGGYTEPRNSRQHFGALLLGVYDASSLVYIGHTGSGFATSGLEEMAVKLRPLQTNKCPFATKPKTNAPAHWVKPKLVCEVKFQEWTDDGRMRIPVFQGLREDKSPKLVRREKEKPVGEVMHGKDGKTTSSQRKKRN
jgi:bifunctional non-homologous end joining protein LigD